MTVLCSLLRRMALLGGALLLSACAAYSGHSLHAGVATLSDVLSTMGEPALRWKDDDGREQLAYPRGPEGTETFMAFIGADGRLERIEAVLDMAHFARVEPGKSDQAAILRLLGPSQPQWTAYFERRDELVWEWRFCDSWNQLAFFDVLFDAPTGIVRTTAQRPDYRYPGGTAPSCGRTLPR
jgi:hypothetical protein